MDEESYEMERSERKSFFCPNKLWEEIRLKTKDKTSISQYIKQAVEEKMEREAVNKRAVTTNY